MSGVWIQRLAAAVAVVALAACGGDGGRATPAEMARQAADGPGGTVTLTGAGATFPYPIYSKWFARYAEAHPVRVNYQSIGSGGGIRQITEGTVDFGASDAPMTDEELARAPGMLHLPTVIGTVAVSYNLPGVTQPLRLDGPALAGIFLGSITRWNDAHIQRLNPGVALPDRDILVVHRTDGSGTTYVFTEYLSAVSPAWRERVGTGKAVMWPVGLGAKGNEGVAGQLKNTAGTIGYVEQVYAQQNGLPSAWLRNLAGEFVAPTLEAGTAAAAGVAERVGSAGDLRVSLVDAAAPAAYPITSWTYLLAPRNLPGCDRARALGELLDWALTEGGDMAREIGYAPLPDDVREVVLARWRTVTCGPENEPVSDTP